ncbi:GNAT family N-acetyltransferase [Qipengyuania sp. 6B39]|uniref:GNAT family N-acetyltransferase n=1 Tax=Qipengyuania proteolytica TaxID=2867239 RepID=UPI001C89B18C|nr:GNAT family N-acetyltransferase [Qipengyuania proteolytica]MBX7497029.1 GNAT family N-acetyltransferase [Qipengyuania proteolytica]
MSEWHIRLARPGDAEGFHAVEEDAANLLRDEPSLQGVSLPPSQSADAYRKLIRRGHCLTAHEAERVVGFAAAAPVGRELHLHELSVARSHQRCGIGATLLEALAVDARNCGLRAITLNTYLDIPWNAPFYARHGYVELEELDSRPHLAQSLEAAVARGLPRERRCVMIRFLG